MIEAQDYGDLVGLANAGADFEVFQTSNVGSYMLRRAEMSEIEALRALARADASDSSEIRRLQLEAAIPGRVIAWVRDVIESGRTAKWELSQIEGKE